MTRIAEEEEKKIGIKEKKGEREEEREKKGGSSFSLSQHSDPSAWARSEFLEHTSGRHVTRGRGRGKGK